MSRYRASEVDSTTRSSSAEKMATRVYNGDPPSEAVAFGLRANRRVQKRKISTSSIILTLFACGIGIILYVDNIITVNRLALEVNQHQLALEKIKSANAMLRAEVNRKTAWDRIGHIATEQLDMRYPKEQPVVLELEEELFNQVQGQ